MRPEDGDHRLDLGLAHVGNDEEVSIYGLAEKIKKKTGSKSEIVKKPYSEVYGFGFEDMQRRIPDVRKLEQFIGYRPRTSLDQIIDDVIAEQRAAMGIAPVADTGKDEAAA